MSTVGTYSSTYIHISKPYTRVCERYNGVVTLTFCFSHLWTLFIVHKHECLFSVRTVFFCPFLVKWWCLGQKFAGAAQRRRNGNVVKNFRRCFENVKRRFLAFCGSFLVFLCMMVITGALKYPNLVHTLIKKGFCSPRWLLQANCLFSTQLFVFLFVQHLNCLFVVSV